MQSMAIGQLMFMEACYSVMSDTVPREYFLRVYEAGEFLKPNPVQSAALDCRAWIWTAARAAMHGFPFQGT